ncbi:uncharacterized protein TNCV_4114121 [Trichonephila clavipes]|nr:uncharacterized protein TNCV_4114121 [Trichonephila clavipes]
MSRKACGCRMFWTYRWAVVVKQINTRDDRVLYAMAPHTITLAVRAVCRCKEKAGLRHLHTNTIVITAEIESGFVAKDDLVPFRYSPVFSCVAPFQTEVSIEDTGAPNEGATYAGWTLMKQLAVRVHFLRCGILLSTVFYRGRPEPGLRVYDISRIHWF